MQFTNIQNITDFIEMTMTERAEFLCKEISKDVKVSSGIYYIYNEECKLWKDYNADYFLTYMFKYLNKLAKSIKSITAGLKDKRVDKLILDFDNKNHVKDLIQRMEGDLQNEEIISKLNHLDDYLPIKNNQKICLKDLTVSERTKEDYFTFECKINICDKTPNADKFFKQLMPKAIHREFLRKVLGYCLSGNTDARCFFVLYGKGSNGKSVIGRIMEAILLNYFVQCSDELFTKTKSDGKPTPHLVCLFLKRFGFYSEGETSDEMELNISTIKRISGQDKITARNLYSGIIQFFSTVKLCMGTNFVPPLTAEKAIKDRLVYLFFDSVFSDNPKNGEYKKDPEFVEKLLNEHLDEIFTWIIKGAVEYYKDPVIKMPEDWQERTTKILEGEDSIETFVTRFIQKTDSEKDCLQKMDLFQKYESFCRKNSQRCQRRSTLFNRLEHMGFSQRKLDGYDVFHSIKCTFKKDDNTGNMFINNNKDDEYETLNKLYDEKDKQFDELNEKYKRLENQLKMVNELIEWRETLDKQIKSRDKLTQSIYDIIGMIDARYEKQFKRLNEHINEVSMRVASLEVDDESDNISESDESYESDEDEGYENGKCSCCGWRAEYEESHILYAIRNSGCSKFTPEDIKQYVNEEYESDEEDEEEFEDYKEKHTYEKSENMFTKSTETKEDYTEIAENTFEEKSTKKIYSLNDNDLEIHNKKYMDSFFDFA